MNGEGYGFIQFFYLELPVTFFFLYFFHFTSRGFGLQERRKGLDANPHRAMMMRYHGGLSLTFSSALQTFNARCSRTLLLSFDLLRFLGLRTCSLRAAVTTSHIDEQIRAKAAKVFQRTLSSLLSNTHGQRHRLQCSRPQWPTILSGHLDRPVVHAGFMLIARQLDPPHCDCRAKVRICLAIRTHRARAMPLSPRELAAFS